MEESRVEVPRVMQLAPEGVEDAAHAGDAGDLRLYPVRLTLCVHLPTIGFAPNDGALCEHPGPTERGCQ